MTGITPDIYDRLRRTLVKCEPFNSNADLSAVFADARIAAWQTLLPEGDSQNQRVNRTIDFLRNKYDANRENALVLLMHVLCDQFNPTDARYVELRMLIHDVEEMFRSNRGQLFEDLLDPASGIQALLFAVDAFIDSLHSLVDSHSASRATKPYKGLAAYGMDEAEAFFGREQDIQALLGKLQNSRLTILHGESGTGKTSLLQAGIAPQLLTRGEIPVDVRVRKQSPVQAIKQVFLDDPGAFPALQAASLHSFLRNVCAAVDRDVTFYIFLDQFEDFFKFLEEAERESFIEQLAACMDDVKLNVRWVLSMRTESFGDLATFRPHIQHPFANDYRLSRLTTRQAETVVTQSAARGDITFETGLVQRILDDLGHDDVLPAQLQLVCDTLVDMLSGRPDKCITHALYDGSGGAAGILQNYLERVLSRELEIDKRKGAWLLIKECLVTFDARRTLCPYSRITSKLQLYGVAPDTIQEILDHLINSRLIQVQHLAVPEAEVAYELTHDYLLGQIKLTPEDEARKRVQELLEQVEDNWQRGITTLLDTRILAELVEPQAEHLGVTDTQAQILLRSAVASRRPTSLWGAKLSPSALEALVSTLSQERYDPNPEVKRRAYAGLWTLRASLSRSLLLLVYSWWTWQQVRRPFMIALLLLLIPMVFIILLELSEPVFVSWLKMDLQGVVQGGKDIRGVSAVAVNPANPDDVYVVDAAGRQLYKRLGIREWVELDTTPWHRSAIYDIAVAGSQVYIVTEEGVFYSQDADGIWHYMPVVLETRLIIEPMTIAVSPNAQDELFIGDQHVGILHSSNGGGKWRTMDIPPILDVAAIHALAANDDFLLVAAGKQLWLGKSPDFTLEQVTFSGCEIADTSWVNALTLPYASSDSFFAVILENGICDGKISSQDWQPVTTPFTTPIFDIAIVESHYYVANKEGLWCQREWDSSKPAWWKAKFRCPIPCRNEN